MSQDAILDELSVRFRRLLLFFILTAVMWLGFWSTPLIRFFGVHWKKIPEITAFVVSSPSAGLFAFWFWIAGALAFLCAIALFLAVGHWWTGRGDIYRRGARMLDQRNRRN